MSKNVDKLLMGNVEKPEYATKCKIKIQASEVDDHKTIDLEKANMT